MDGVIVQATACVSEPTHVGDPTGGMLREHLVEPIRFTHENRGEG